MSKPFISFNAFDTFESKVFKMFKVYWFYIKSGKLRNMYAFQCFSCGCLLLLFFCWKGIIFAHMLLNIHRTHQNPSFVFLVGFQPGSVQFAVRFIQILEAFIGFFELCLYTPWSISNAFEEPSLDRNLGYQSLFAFFARSTGRPKMEMELLQEQKRFPKWIQSQIKRGLEN